MFRFLHLASSKAGGLFSQFSKSLSNPAFRVGVGTSTAVRVMAFLGRRSAACSLVGGTRKTQDTDSVSHRPPWLAFGIRELLWLNFNSERVGGFRVNRPHLPSTPPPDFISVVTLDSVLCDFLSKYYIFNSVSSVLL
jgi:hypothetical protein